MKNTWFRLLIVLSIALQSLVAVANSNDNHQVDSQHLKIQHSHETDNLSLINDDSQDKHDSQDCHHCGHCQGSHTQWFTSKKAIQIIPVLIVSNQYFHLIQPHKNFIEQLIRPPIA